MLFEKYKNEINGTFVNRKGSPYVSLELPEILQVHGGIDIVGDMPKALIKRSTKKITASELNKYGLLNMLFDPIMDGIFSQNVHVELSGPSYLTNRDIDLQVALSVGTQKDIRSAQSFIEGFKHVVPAIDSVPIEKLIELRNKEGESFEVYRTTLRSALQKARNLNSKEIKELVVDEVLPQVSKINMTIKEAKSNLMKNIIKDISIGSAYVGIGLFSGFLSKETGSVLAALGGYKFIDSTFDKITKTVSIPDKVKENPYFFLWKMRKEM